MKRLFVLLLFLTFGMVVSSAIYPLRVKDFSGDEVIFHRRPERIAIQNGIDVIYFFFLDSGDPLRDVVIIGDNLRRYFGDLNLRLAFADPRINRIEVMDYRIDDPGKLLESRPDLLIADLIFRDQLERNGVLERLRELGVNVVFIKSWHSPVNEIFENFKLLARILDREKEARRYLDDLSSLRSGVRPGVVELLVQSALVEVGSAGDCCSAEFVAREVSRGMSSEMAVCGDHVCCEESILWRE